MTIVTPRKCGLYETTHETVKGLRALGVDSAIVDPDPAHNPVNWAGGDEERGVPVRSLAWAKDADVVISHSGPGDHFTGTDKPIVYVAHGRPLVSYLSEKAGKLPLQSYFYGLNKNPQYKAVVTYWPEHVDYLKVMFWKKPVHCIQSSVDLDAWCPGESSYDFGGKGGDVNVVISDAWREDVDPFRAINAFGTWARSHPEAKLHIYGLPKKQPGAWALVQSLIDQGMIGEIIPWSDRLQEVYNAADFVLTPHVIDVRTVREAMACGCPVVRIGESLQFVEPSQDREAVRAEAVARFDSTKTALQFKRILESL